MRPSRLALLASMLAAVALACNALLGLDELTPFEGLEAGASSSSGGSSGLVETGPDDPDGETPDGSSSSSGGKDGDAGVAPCDPTEVPDVVGSVFVKAGSNGDGRMNNPFGSVANAIDRLAAMFSEEIDGGSDAGAHVPTIYVYAGSYSETRPLVVNGFPAFKIDGAWAGPLTQWSRDCSVYRRSNTVVNAILSRGIVIRNVDGPSTISNLSLFTGVVAADSSRIGVQVINSGPLTISNAVVVAENAQADSDAPAGSTGEPVCSALGPECKVAPQPGTDGAAGAHGTQGTFTVAGFEPGDGVAGSGGTTGEISRPGPPQQDDCVVSCPAPSADPLTCPAAVVEPLTAPEGTCGCGGGKGSGGGGGKGGGASVALLTNTTVRVEYSILQAKNGGPGLPGAAGGAAGLGLPGTAGGTLVCNAEEGGCCLEDNGAGAPVCKPGSQMPGTNCYVPPVVLQGGAATTGARGGAGGNGGNGAGGPSYTTVLLPGGHAEYIESSRSFGPGGPGVAPAPTGGSAFELLVEE